MSETIQRRPARRNRTRNKIFAAAMEQLDGLPSGSVSVDTIAAAAGVSKGSVYYNFGSKLELFEQLLSYGADLLLTQLRETCSLPEQLGIAFDFLEKNPAFGQLWITEIWLAPTNDPVTLRDVRKEFIDLLAESLANDPNVKRGLEPIAVLGAVLLVARDRNMFNPDRTRDDCVASIQALLS
ncbi:hypothetical protein BSZ39_11205 [Bowdeniella nasicola]|uniref:HTH tetR-type domain-containing protein n=1 Tax=Bowdeniella nasicola TaxID=208480 RepID=A0A1Q5PZS9_9ACTO|nr:TetR/AcrR family transcriptional regulator [Bowdeniella nasicola]OKL53124.1 hypothetical protein BSZ39_11205 [Bowdeniella nasicola]